MPGAGARGPLPWGGGAAAGVPAPHAQAPAPAGASEGSLSVRLCWAEAGLERVDGAGRACCHPVRPRTPRPLGPHGRSWGTQEGCHGQRVDPEPVPEGWGIFQGRKCRKGRLPNPGLGPVSRADLVFLPRGLIHLLTHIAEALHQARLLIILVIPPAVTPG